MNKRSLATIIGCLVVTALVMGGTGCGSGTAATTTTAQPATTTTAMAASTTTSAAAQATTSSSGATVSSTTTLVLSPAMQQYRNEIVAFGQALASLPNGDPTSVSDVSKVTSEDLQAGTAFVTAMHSAIDKLKAVQPPPELAAVHQQLVDAVSGLAAVTDKSLQALQGKDQAALSAAQSEGKPLASKILTLLQGLQSQLGALQP